MKMLYRRFLSLIGAGVVAFSVAGCQSNQDIKNSSSSEDNTSVSSSEQKQEKKNDLSNAAMLGNSYMYGFDTYAVLPNTDCFYVVGLNVRTAFEKSMINSDIPVIEELNKDKQYDEVFLMFGENELGWPNEQAFLDGYGEIIDTVKEYQPEADIYVQSMLPVSAEVSAKNKDGVNNENIKERNEHLKELAEEKEVYYLDVAEIMQDENGNLPDGAATDGIHPSISYYKKWAEYLMENVEQEK